MCLCYVCLRTCLPAGHGTRGYGNMNLQHARLRKYEFVHAKNSIRKMHLWGGPSMSVATVEIAQEQRLHLKMNMHENTKHATTVRKLFPNSKSFKVFIHGLHGQSRANEDCYSCRGCKLNDA